MNKVVKIIFVLVVFLNVNSLIYSQAVMWQRYYSYSKFNSQNDIIQTYDGGYLMAGGISSPPGTSILLIKINYLGLKEWEKILNDSANNIGVLSVKQTYDSGFIMTGQRNNDAFLLKTDKSGNFVWRKSYNCSDIADGYNVNITIDNCFIIGGVTYSISPFISSSYIVKTDSIGKIIWEKTYRDSLITDGAFILEIPGNQFIFTCVTRASFSSPYFGMCYKLNSLGEIIWKKDIGENKSLNPILYKFNEGLFLCGYEEVLNTYKLHFSKLDTSGNLILQKTYDSSLAYNSIFYKENYGFIFGGDKIYNNDHNFAAIKIDINGNYIFTKIIDTPDSSEDYCSKVNLTNDNGFIFVGKTNFGRSSGDPYNVLIAKTDSVFYTTPIVGIQTSYSEIPNEFLLSQNYPNPFNSTTVIKYKLKNSSRTKIVFYDITGKEVITYSNLENSQNNGSITFDGNVLGSGIYFYSLYVNNVLFSTNKMILLK